MGGGGDRCPCKDNWNYKGYIYLNISERATEGSDEATEFKMNDIDGRMKNRIWFYGS